MTEIIVLLKLVPDIRHIPADAWDLTRGTLRRNKLQLIPNPMDDRALELALRLKAEWGGRVTALSMGPPAAGAICSRALAFGADRAVLVSDPACAGADTLATSVVLARAVSRLTDTLESTVIISGMQSPDGDTAQVPVQVAAMLNAAVVPYVTQAFVSAAHADLVSLASGGSVKTRLDAGSLPAVVTCTEQLPTIPFHTPLSELLRASGEPVEILTAERLGLKAEEVGLAGSATRVVTISVAESVRREVEYIDWSSHGDSSGVAATVVSRLGAALSGGSDVDTQGNPETPGDDPAAGASVVNDDVGIRQQVPGAVWAVVGTETDTSRLAVLAHARRIADAIGCAAVAVVTGEEAGEDLTVGLGAAGATAVLLITGANGSNPVLAAEALEAAVTQFCPVVVLLPASPEGRVTAPYLAARLGAGLTADCTDFAIRDYRVRKGGERRTYPNALYQIRPALGGNIQATIVSPRNIEGGLPQMATVRPGPTVVHGAATPSITRWAALARKAPASTGGGRAGSSEEGAFTSAGSPGAADGLGRGRINIERCKVLVSVGRGVGGGEGIAAFAEPLAEAVRNRFDVDVEVSASRMVVDAGDVERDRQVGQTGKVVKPDIYLALGISGSAQHRAGMDGSHTIVSVNADAEAPIRHISDVFVHGRVEDVVPAVIRALSDQVD